MNEFTVSLDFDFHMFSKYETIMVNDCWKTISIWQFLWSNISFLVLSALCLSCQSPSSEWQKFDYLLEFGQWLYCNEFPLQEAVDMFEWAIDILLNMKIEIEEKREGMGIYELLLSDCICLF